MSAFVQSPNLPEDAETILIGEKYARILQKSLEKQGLTSVFIPDNPYVDARMSGHADLSAVHGGGERLFLAPYLRGSETERKLMVLGAEPVFPEISQGSAYPGDAQLNLCAAGKAVFYNEKTAAPGIVEYLTRERGLAPIRGRQGYARCAVCVVGPDALITADRPIYEAALKNGYRALLIRPGYIGLEGFPYGFIGGAAFKLSKHRLAFTGRLDTHPNWKEILSFLEAQEVEPVFLTDVPAFDIGSAIPLTEV